MAVTFGMTYCAIRHEVHSFLMLMRFASLSQSFGSEKSSVEGTTGSWTSSRSPTGLASRETPRRRSRRRSGPGRFVRVQPGSEPSPNAEEKPAW